MFLWLALKLMLLELQKIRPLQEQLRRFKYNADVFNNVLKEQPRYALLDESWSIGLGNMEADTIITLVSNPYCEPCSRTHQQVDLLDSHADLQVRIVFTASNNDQEPKTQAVRHLMALNDCRINTTVNGVYTCKDMRSLARYTTMKGWKLGRISERYSQERSATALAEKEIFMVANSRIWKCSSG